jgi:hypothetical protein
MEQVTGILVRNEIPYEFLEDGQEIGLITDQVSVFLRPREMDGDALLHIAADLAVGIDLTLEVAAGIYVWLNQRNAEEPLVRFVLHEVTREGSDIPGAWVSAEWELAADKLDSDALIPVLNALAHRAGSFSRPLTELFGGQTSVEVKEECDALNRGELDEELGLDDSR